MTIEKMKITPQIITDARKAMGMTQQAFAKSIGISPRTLQEWEQGRRTPRRTAQILLMIMIKHPDKVRSVINP